jgi:hypothetical protein
VVLATTNDAETLPPEIEHVGEAIAGLDTNEHGETSVVKNPTPVTEIVWAATPDVGVSVIVGARIVKGSETVSNAPPVECAVTL